MVGAHGTLGGGWLCCGALPWGWDWQKDSGSIFPFPCPFSFPFLSTLISSFLSPSLPSFLSFPSPIRLSSLPPPPSSCTPRCPQLRAQRLDASTPQGRVPGKGGGSAFPLSVPLSPSLCPLPSVPARLRGRRQPWMEPRPGRAERGGGRAARLGGFPPAAAISPCRPGSAEDKPARSQRRSLAAAGQRARASQAPARASWPRPAYVAAGRVRPPRHRPATSGDASGQDLPGASLGRGRRSCRPRSVRG